MKNVFLALIAFLSGQFLNAQERITVQLANVYCSTVDDGRVGSHDGEELFGYLRCGVSTNGRPITDYSNGVTPLNGSHVLFLKNSKNRIQLKSKEDYWIKESRTFDIKADEVANARVFLNGDLDELDGNGMADDVTKFLAGTPLGKVPVAQFIKIFHRDDNDKLEKFKADERMFIRLVTIPKGQTKMYMQRFASGGTNINVYWYVTRN